MNNIFLIHGEDDFLAQEKLKFLKEGFIKKYGDLNISVYNEESKDASNIYNDINSVPFLSEKRLLIMENLLSKWDKDEKKKFTESVANFPESTVVIFFEKQKIKDSDLLLKNIPPKNIFYKPLLRGYEINNWIAKKISEKGYKIDKEALATLASLVGNNSRQLDKELQKLTALKHQDKIIKEEDVKKLVKSNLDTNIFNLTEALAKKDLRSAQKTIKNLSDAGENLYSILSMVAFQFRNLLFLKIGEKEKIPKETILKETGMHPYVFQKTSAQLKNFSEEKLKKIYNLILHTDIDIKTGKKDEGLAIDLLITKICS